jgi:hypothetical protein
LVHKAHKVLVEFKVRKEHKVLLEFKVPKVLREQ